MRTRKQIIQFITFLTVNVCIAGVCFLSGSLLDIDLHTGKPYYIVLGLSCITTAILGPALADYINKRLSKKRD